MRLLHRARLALLYVFNLVFYSKYANNTPVCSAATVFCSLQASGTLETSNVSEFLQLIENTGGFRGLDSLPRAGMME